jgi:hypothetical protein
LDDRGMAGGAGAGGAAQERRESVELKASVFGACVALVTMLVLGALSAATVGPIEPSQPHLEGDDTSAFWISSWIASVFTLLISFLGGGFAAARIGRFHQPANGVAASGLAAAVMALFALLGLLLGSEYDLFARLNLPNWSDEFGAQAFEALLAVFIWLSVMFGSGWLGGALGSKVAGRPPDVA